MNIAEPAIIQQPSKTRRSWLANRKKLEAIRFNRISEKAKQSGRITPLEQLVPFVTAGLQVLGIYNQGFKNALNISLKEYELYFHRLPDNFHGYRILHLSDLHIDGLPGLEDVVCRLIEGLEYDLCTITGDYRLGSYGNYSSKVTTPLKKIACALRPKDGTYATLGNHDTHQVVSILENSGFTVLTNETQYIRRGNDQILVTGTDDPYAYYTHQMVEALKSHAADFKIALVHSPELYQEAALEGYDFYLCGHTHAGQICLPSGIPMISHLKKGKHLVSNFWQERHMVGYTSAGCGTSGLPIRFNCQGEITLFTLKNH